MARKSGENFVILISLSFGGFDCESNRGPAPPLCEAVLRLVYLFVVLPLLERATKLAGCTCFILAGLAVEGGGVWAEWLVAVAEVGFGFFCFVFSFLLGNGLLLDVAFSHLRAVRTHRCAAS